MHCSEAEARLPRRGAHCVTLHAVTYRHWSSFFPIGNVGNEYLRPCKLEGGGEGSKGGGRRGGEEGEGRRGGGEEGEGRRGGGGES